MVITHNMASMIASNNLMNVKGKYAKSAERLGSGYKLNRAADDTAGLAISEKMRAQIRGLNKASNNAQQGISYIQIADGALGELHSLLQRGRELCIQAGNDTNTDADRAALQSEINQISKEVDNIAKNTQFNSMNIFDASNARSSVTTKSGDVLKTLGGDIDLSNIVRYSGLDYTGAASAANAAGISFIDATNLETFAQKLRDTYLPTILNHIQSAMPDVIPPLQNDDLEIGLTFYCGVGDGTLAYCGSNGAGYELGINMAYLTNNSGSIAIDGDMGTTIAHELMHGIMFDMTTNGMLGTGGGDSFPDWVVEGFAQAVGGATNYVSEAKSYVRNGQDDLLSEWCSKLNDGGYSAYSQGYIASMYLGYVCSGASDITSANCAKGINDLLKKVEDGYSLSQAINILTNGTYYDLADFETRFETEGVQFTKDFLNACGTDGCGSIVMNSLGDSKDSMLTGNSNKSGNYFLLNLDTEGYIDNWSKYQSEGVDPWTGGGATTTNGIGEDGNVNPDAATSWGSAKGSSNAVVAGSLQLQVGALPLQGVELNRWKLSAKDLNILNVDVSSFENAGNGINKYDMGIEVVSQIRSYYGAIQNRLEHTIANVDNTSENTQAAESLIRDTNMADEMTEYAKYNILAQVGQSVLAQANQSTESVLNLLK